MEKFYCENCRLIYSKLEHCKICGDLATKKIWIEVQKQETKSNESGNDPD